MKKGKTVSVLLVLFVMIQPFVFFTYAYQNKSSNFYSATYSSDPGQYIANIALAQVGRTQSSFGYTEAWCADFVSDCAVKANESSAIPAHAVVANLRNNIINAGGTVVSSPQAGDIIFYYCSICKGYKHTAVCINSYQSVHGNLWSNYVSYCRQINNNWFEDDNEHKVGSGISMEYIRPKYSSNGDTSAPTIENPFISNLSGDSFTVNCDLSDNVGVTSVWLNVYGPGGEKGYSVAASNGRFSHTIYTSEYGGPGWYSVHIYPADAAGNASRYAFEGIHAISEPPKTPNNLKSDKQYYTNQDPISFTWDAVENATEYWVYMWKDGIQIYQTCVGNSTGHGAAPMGAGHYTLYVRAGNSAGYSETAGVSFIIFDSIHAYSESVYEERIILNGHIYESYKGCASWSDAKLFAEQLGGHLAVITSSEEQNAIQELVSEGNYWIGATDEDEEGIWKWVTGEPFVYSNWHPDGQPDNWDDKEHYAHVYGNSGFWNDLPLNGLDSSVIATGFIVEYEPELITTKTYNGHIYEVYSGQTNWKAAKIFAEKNGGHLVTITSSEEQNAIQELVSEGNYWIGATDEAEESVWKWVTDEPFVYSNWHPDGQPDNWDGKEHYAHVYGNSGYWNDLPNKNDSIFGFIIEYESCKNGHTWDSGVVTSSPTCKDEGVKTYTCTVCGETKTETIAKTEDHVWNAGEITVEPTYTAPGEKTFTCTVCGKTKTETIDPLPQPDEPDAVITVAKVNAQPGKTVDVTVDLTEYAPMSYLLLGLAYDKTVLTLDKVTNGGLFDTFENGANLLLSAGEDIAAAGNVLTLTFTVDENAEAGEYPVTVICRQCYNNEEEPLLVKVENSMITVIDVLIGDVNGDGVIDGRDLIRLRKYLANLDEETGESTAEITAGADCTGDGIIDGRDLIRLRKYLANLDEETGVSTVTLG